MTLLNFRFAHQAQRSPDDLSAEAVERALVDRIRAGDMDAFETLYRSYWQPLYAFAFRYVRSKPDAEDVTQEVFLRIWRGRADWLPAGPVRNYLYLAVRNAARDRLARAAVARRSWWRLGQVETTQAFQCDLESRELAAAVERALAALPPKRAALCRLRLIDGLSYAEIADRLGIGTKTVETQLARGLKTVREQIRRAQ
ncbi:MAG TPA: RNA polymerase sigma-70 factor [Gemmatimonadales bacterium]